MTPLVYIIGIVILGVAALGAAFVITAALAEQSKKANAPKAATMPQPPLAYLTEFDTADYIGVSIKELDFMREDGLLDGSFISVTSLEKTGEEEYYDTQNGVEVIKVRPILSSVTRFLFSKEMLDEKMSQLMKDSKNVNTVAKRYSDVKRPTTKRKSADAEVASENGTAQKKADLSDILNDDED